MDLPFTANELTDYKIKLQNREVKKNG